jgi:hypothetical protein
MWWWLGAVGMSLRPLDFAPAFASGVRFAAGFEIQGFSF